MEKIQNRTALRAALRGLLRSPIAAVAIGLAAWQMLPAHAGDPGVAYAQNSNATIRGQVLDPNGGLVPGATVLIVNQDTNVQVFRGTTDSSGSFVAPQVIPGTYRVTVNAPGLKTATVNNLIATVSQVASINIDMQLGDASETVTVESKGEQLDRATSNISTLISPSDVANLPLYSRATENILAFVPGVASGGNPTQVSTSQLSINGSRTLNTEVLLNGVSTIVASTGTPATLPSPDGIDELRFLTSNAPAQYGRTSGAVLSANIRSGTNAYHGSVYALVQNEALNANSYFNKISPSRITPRSRRRFFQFGGSFGGPVWIPKVFNGHDKLFFFVNYDKTIQHNAATSTINVPDANKRMGLFLPTSTAINPVFHPQSVVPYQTVAAPGGGTGYQITDPINPATAKILALLPLPNFPGTEDAPNGRYTGNFRIVQQTSPETLKLATRVDYQMTSRDRLSVNLYRFNSPSPNGVNYGVPLLETNFDCSCTNAWITNVDYTRTWSSTLVTDLNMGFFRNVVLRNPPGTGLGASAALGIANLPLDQTPQITYTGYNNIGADTNTNQINITNTFSPYGTVTKTWGPHTFMFGAQFRKNQFNSYNPSGSPQGTIGFGGAVTNKGASGNANTSMADFYLGLVNSGNYQTPMPETGRRNFNIGVFFQDDWKVTPKLTVNAGIRYEYEAPLYIANNIYSRISPSTGTLLVAGQNGASRSLNVSTPKLDFSPRIGFAFSANDKTVIRGAFGTFYGTIFQNLGGQLAYPGYDVTSNFTLNPNTPSAAAPPQGTPLSYTLDQTFSNANVIPRDLNNPVATINAYTVTNPLSVGAVSFNKMDKMPMVQQWNLGVQRQLPFGIIFEANYVGNHTLHLAYNIPYNLVPLTAANVSTAAIAGNNATNNAVVQPLRAFPRLKSFSGVDNVGMSNYNSLQIVGRRQFNTRFAVLSNYTYAKSMDDGSTIYNFSAPNGTANAQYIGDPNLRRMDYAVSNIDIKHRVSVAIQYTSAGPWWMRGWTVAPTFVGQTGLPLNITQSNNAAVDMSQQRPNGRIQDIIIKPYFDGTALRYYKNPSLSSIPAGDTSFPLTPAGAVLNTAKTALLTNPATPLGTMPRDAGRAFGIVEFDASVSKTFGLYRNLKFQLRLDAFNVLNHTNFGAPTTTLSSGSDCVKTGTTCSGPEVANFRGNSSGFGQITGTSTPARQMQVQGRITF